jgi:hypothetical protein
MGPNVIRLGIDQLPAELARGEKRFERALERGLRRGAERGRAIIVKKTPTDLGQLRASWKVKSAQMVAELINDAPHAGIVELGARPHAVGPEGWHAIYEWVRRHPEMYGEKKARTRVSASLSDLATSGPFKGSDPEITAITNAIVQKIRRYGQKPTYFVRNNLESLKAALIAEVERQLELATKQKGGTP